MRTRHVAIVAALLLQPALASGAVLCVRKNPVSGSPVEGAATRLRSASCKNSEIQVDPIALGLQGPVGPQGEPGAPGPGVALRDATGALVGPAFAELESGDLGVIYQAPTGNVHLRTQGLNALGGEQSTLYFTSSDCTGQPYIEFGDRPLLPAAVTPLTPGSFFYAAGPRTFLTTNSSRSPNYGICYVGTGTSYYAPAAGPVSFVPPFTLDIH